MGSADAIEKVKEDLRKMLWFERTSRDVLEVSSQVAEKVLEQREALLRSPLWGLKVDIQGDHGTVTLRGKKEGITIAQESIRGIQKKIEQEVTEDISVDTTLHNLVKYDHRAWIDIVKRCGGSPGPDSSKHPFVLDIMPEHIKVRGPPNLITALRAEVAELADIGHDCVLAKRITARRHQSLLDGGVIQNIRRHARAMVYFPDSGGYQDIGRPENINDYSDNVNFEDIVKVVGRREECEKAKGYLEDLVEQQRKEERNPLYLFPAVLYSYVKLKLDPMLKTLGIKEESTVPASSDSIVCLISQDEDLITAFGPGWSIHKRSDLYRARDDQSMCEMRLTTRTDEDKTKAREHLQKIAGSLWRRIGVLELQRPSHSRLLQEKVSILENQADELLCQLVENPGPPRLVIGGTPIFLSANCMELIS
ncbi:hypothetical protein JB92DRAFT_2115045 [Gautieria morchelliformis]|nr:hypothetical protein JB92DRAFT_2115045 [Gautieria morchelliformis]